MPFDQVTRQGVVPLEAVKIETLATGRAYRIIGKELPGSDQAGALSLGAG